MRQLHFLILIGISSMLVLAILRRKRYEFAIWKVMVIVVSLAISGIIGTKLMNFIEKGDWNGMSFFGAVFFVPLFLIIIKLFINEPYLKVMDFSAPEGCIMLCVMKINCSIAGCCHGIRLFQRSNGTVAYFPIQLIEAITAAIIMCYLLWLEYREIHDKKRYAIFLLIYGISRFILNFFRGSLSTIFWVIPEGHFWSVVSILIGIIWLGVIGYNDRRRCDDNK